MIKEAANERYDDGAERSIRGKAEFVIIREQPPRISLRAFETMIDNLDTYSNNEVFKMVKGLSTVEGAVQHGSRGGSTSFPSIRS